MTTRRVADLHVRRDPGAEENWALFIADGASAGEFVDLLTGLDIDGRSVGKATLWRHNEGTLAYARPSSLELIYLIEGRALIESTQADQVEITAGDFLHVPQGFAGTWTTLEPVLKYSVTVTRSTVR